MDYNTSRTKMKLPEYGRNVQRMVDYLITIEDRDKRNKNAFAIINVMGSMFPHLRDVPEFKQKLWDHLAIMSDFKLDIDSPYPMPSAESLNVKVEKMPYLNSRITIRHYGKIIEELMKKAISFENEEERKQLVLLIANHMKKSYLAWNKDVVTDDKIFDDLRFLSQGKLDYSEKDFQLIDSRMVIQAPKKKKNPNKVE